jgi:PAS domain-containing protein
MRATTGCCWPRVDVTHLREAEQARRESEERYANLFHIMSQAVIYLDGEGVVLSANPAAEKLLGLTIDEMRGRRRADLWWRATKEDGTPISLDEFPSMVALRNGSERHDVVLRIWNAWTEEPPWVSTDVIPRVKAGDATGSPCASVIMAEISIQNFCPRDRVQRISQHVQQDRFGRTRDGVATAKALYY